jgi:hypothetical protein
MEVTMFAILRVANGRRHEVDFRDDPVTVDVAMSTTTVQITMTAAGSSDLATSRYVTVALPRNGTRFRRQSRAHKARPFGLRGLTAERGQAGEAIMPRMRRTASLEGPARV